MPIQTTVADIQSVLPLIALWVAAAIVLLGGTMLWRRTPWANAVVSLLGVLAALACVITPRSGLGRAGIFGGVIAVDGLSQSGSLILLFAAAISVLLATSYLQRRGIDRPEYYALILFSTSGAMLMAAASELLVLFIGLEILSLGLYVLAGFARTQARSEEASIKYFLLGAFASALMLYGIALVYGATQTTNIELLRNATWFGAHHAPMLLAGLALILAGLSFKVGAAPFHQWAPDVYEGAPTSATAFMAAAAKVGAFVAMLRLLEACSGMSGFWIPVIQVLAIASMVVGNVAAVAQTNVKRMLAYSSVAHAGYLLVGVAAGGQHNPSPMGVAPSVIATPAVLFYLAAYAIVTLGAFGVLIYLSDQGRDMQALRDLRGLARRDPVAGYSLLVLMLSLAGVPPTMGFMAKWQVFLSALTANHIAVAITMAVTSAIAAFYYLRVVYTVCFEEPEHVPAPVEGARSGATASMVITAVAAVLFGVAPGLLVALTSFAN